MIKFGVIKEGVTPSVLSGQKSDTITDSGEAINKKKDKDQEILSNSSDVAKIATTINLDKK
jgi:hypothetical protein